MKSFSKTPAVCLLYHKLLECEVCLPGVPLHYQRSTWHVVGIHNHLFNEYMNGLLTTPFTLAPWLAPDTPTEKAQ